MGLNKRNTNITYLNLKDGKIYESTDKEKQNPFDEIEGIITGFAFREDEYQGTKILKCNVTINDGERDYVLSMKEDSSYFSSMVGFLKNADLTRPVALVPFSREEKDGKVRMGILVRQGKDYLKGYYTKDNPNGLPQMKQVRVNGKDLWDKTEYIDFLKNVVVNELAPQLTDGEALAPQGLKSSNPQQTAQPVEMSGGAEHEDMADDLPF